MEDKINIDGFEIVLDNEKGGVLIRCTDYHANELQIGVELAEKILSAAKRKLDTKLTSDILVVKPADVAAFDDIAVFEVKLPE